MFDAFRYTWKRRILLALAIMGPGIITAVADNDAAGVSTYTTAAASYGYQMFIILIPMTFLLAITQEIGARIAIVSQKGLADLIRERYGVRVAIVIYTLLFFVNLFVVIMDVAGLKAALGLFGLNPMIFLPLITIGLFLFVVLSNYSVIERFFLILVGFYATYAISAFLAKPDWGVAITSLVVPHGVFNARFLYVAIAVLGTTITAWGQFFINSYVKDKHLGIDQIKYNRFEVYMGSIVTDTLTFFIMVAVTATIFANHIGIHDAADAALAIHPLAGNFAGILFGLGLLFAGILGVIIVSLTTAYAFSEFFGYSGSLDENFRQSKLFYITLCIQMVIALLVTMLPFVSLFTITLFGNFINAMVLPVIFYFLYQFANDKATMSMYVNNKFQNWLLIGSAAVIIISVLVGTMGQLLGI
jgi:NRAMP (natural resistance-associated macrophage protein)-like metal ion transporter